LYYLGRLAMLLIEPDMMATFVFSNSDVVQGEIRNIFRGENVASHSITFALQKELIFLKVEE